MKNTILLLSLIFLVRGAVASACFNNDLLISQDDWSKKIDRVVNSYLKTYMIPGATVLVGNAQGVTFKKGYNHSLDTIFDIASITKLFTASSIMLEVEKNNLKITDKVSSIFPKHLTSIKQKNISIEDLLRHISGFRAGVLDDVFTSEIEKTWDNILKSKVAYTKGSFKYSDINYLVLGKLLEEKTKMSLDTYVHDNFFKQLDMSSSFYTPKDLTECQSKCAATIRDGDVGVVHDPTSRKLGGVAGHAGVFTTIDDLAKFTSIFLNKGEYCGKSILAEATVKSMVKKVKKQSRGLGFDITSGYSRRARGEFFSKGLSFGHTGFTGASLWIDPTIDTFVIVLTNTVYAKNEKFAKKGFLMLIEDLANIVGQTNSI